MLQNTLSRRSALALGCAGAALLAAPRGEAAARGGVAGAAQATAFERLRYGAAWYPEQWPEAAWDRDLDLMREAGFTVVRVGEFAWSTFEPAEGRYELDWLDRAIRKAAARGIAVVIGTPTDAPPAWLTSRYPETLRIDERGVRAEHGGRRQFSNASPLYRTFCRKIVDQLAARFGRHPNVIGWQIGNEYTDESFDPATRGQFQAWLKAKYQTLEALNAAWATTYWSQSYSAWEQIPLNDKPGNPGLMLDHRHFVTDTWIDFQKVQVDAIRAVAQPRQFITTNVGGLGWSANWDHYAVNRDLDIASWDPYVGSGHLDPVRAGAVNDFVRGWKRQNFWVMETQPGFVNWSPLNNSLDRGEVRAMVWQQVGHGADAVLYWQWRNALNGQEQYHGSVVGPDGEPLPLYAEVKTIGQEFARASAVVAGTSPKAETALLYSYDSRWAIDFQPHTKEYDQLKVLLAYYAPLKAAAGTVDIVEASAPLDGYKVVFAPSLNLIPQALADHLAAYVKRGGRLVLGPRSGMKDAFNRLQTERQPGPLAAVLGGRVEQYYALDQAVAVDGPAGAGAATIWGEALSARAPDAKVILTYGPGQSWLAGQPAALQRSFGKGVITYLGGLFDPALTRTLLTGELAAGGVGSDFPGLPEGVEVNRRVGPDREVYVLINHAKAPTTAALPFPLDDVLGPRRGLRSADLPAYGVAVLQRRRRA
jgi:beta-galactosidase